MSPPYDLVRTEIKCLPFVHVDPDLDLWTDQLRAWPFPMDGWVDWYKRVERSYSSTWQTIHIANALTLSISLLWRRMTICLDPSAISGRIA